MLVVVPILAVPYEADSVVGRELALEVVANPADFASPSGPVAVKYGAGLRPVTLARVPPIQPFLLCTEGEGWWAEKDRLRRFPAGLDLLGRRVKINGAGAD